MSSTRLPGKVLANVCGKTLLEYTLEHSKRVGVSGQVGVLTSSGTEDDPIAELCGNLGVPVYRGELNNVAARFYGALNVYPCEFFVRLNADSPLHDHRLIQHAISLASKGRYQIVANAFPKSFPKGLGTEVIEAETFCRAFPHFHTEHQTEHVTPFFYENSAQFNIHNFANPADYSAMSLAVDTAEELENVRRVIAQLNPPISDYSWQEYLELIKKVIS